MKKEPAISVKGFLPQEAGCDAIDWGRWPKTRWEVGRKIMSAVWTCLEMGLEKIVPFFWCPEERLMLEILVWEPNLYK